MHCTYCGVDYNAGDFCRCLPSGPPDVAADLPLVNVPWGEAAAHWSMEPGRDVKPPAEA